MPRPLGRKGASSLSPDHFWLRDASSILCRRSGAFTELTPMNLSTRAFSVVAVAALTPGAQAGMRPAAEHYGHARQIYATVIGFQTSVGLGQVPKMAEYLADQFRAGGFASADVHVIPFGETASLVVRYRSDGSGGKPILLNAHMDVVTANRGDWQRDPFKLAEEDGYFFGRGTWDDKIDVVTLTETFLRLKAESFVPKR